jgi:hypothetical protein
MLLRLWRKDELNFSGAMIFSGEAESTCSAQEYQEDVLFSLNLLDVF